ncbi:MAG: FAD/NAD(P)-binding protein [Solirubrobacteraceae bacterium]|jgi:uncharacterized NAD(P)/FAD-binding protein YdhS
MSSQARKPPLVAIVGGGCAGTLVASNLLRRFDGRLRVVMIERSGRFGPGVAYATEDPRHLLNVPAERMSAFRDAPSHFAEWAAERLGGIGGASYLPRGVYGEYLRDVLDDSRAHALPQRTLELVAGEVLGASRTRTGIALRLADAAPIACDRVVLATGAPGVAAMAQLPRDPRVVYDPWAPGALSSGGSKGLTLVLGTGLSGVDAALSLSSGRGWVLAISRGGQLPYVHLPGLRAPAPPPAVPRGRISLAALERRLTEHVSIMQGAGYDWRDAIDGLRAVTPQLWAVLGPRERRRFLRERRRTWDARRHRMAPVAGSRLRELLASAQVRCLAGRVLAARSTGAGVEVDVAPSRSGRVRSLTCQRVVVCTGAGMDIRRSGNELLDTLLADGLASPDPLALGLRTTADGALLDSRGDADERVLTLGALRRGELWETTAVDEIRGQAERLVGTLERSLSSDEDLPSNPAGADRRRVSALA